MSIPGTCLNIVGAVTTKIKQDAGTLLRLIINKPVASATITIYDNNGASGTKLATITLPATLLSDGPHGAEFNAVFTQGLTVVTTGAGLDISVVYI